LQRVTCTLSACRRLLASQHSSQVVLAGKPKWSISKSRQSDNDVGGVVPECRYEFPRSTSHLGPMVEVNRATDKIAASSRCDRFIRALTHLSRCLVDTSDANMAALSLAI